MDHGVLTQAYTGTTQRQSMTRTLRYFDLPV